MILKLVFWIIAIYGTTQIIVESTLFKPMRNMFDNIYSKPIYILLTCMMCSSAWISFTYSICLWSPSDHIFQEQSLIRYYDLTFFIDGMFGSCCVWFIHLFEKTITVFISKTNKEIDKLNGL